MVVMCRRPGAEPQEISPPGVSVRSRVHEYGGGAHRAVGDSLLYTDLADQALWWLEPGRDPVRLTPPPPAGETHRYADARPVAGDRFVVALRERHHDGAVDDELVAIDRRGRLEPTVLHAGRDFFAAPRPDPDGDRLAWLAWDHPNMPWDGTELWLAELVLPGPDDAAPPRLDQPPAPICSSSPTASAGGSPSAGDRGSHPNAWPPRRWSSTVPTGRSARPPSTSGPTAGCSAGCAAAGPITWP
jgi:hypothetical protein